ncbi:MAG: tetratricopeptide repeat protein [Ruminococcus sp.]|jgi:tetratricopeptide (TPR) repeat protein
MPKKIKTALISIFILLLLAMLVIFIMIFLRVRNTGKYNDLLSLGEKYLQEMNYEDAAIAFQNAIKIDEKKEDGYVCLAQVYAAEEDYNQAASVLLIGYDTAGATELLREMMVSIYPSVSSSYQEEIRQRIGDDALPDSDIPETQPETEPTATATPTPAPAFTLTDLEGSWMQTGSDDPILLTLGSDGSLQYYAVVSHESEYNSNYTLEGETLWLNLLPPDSGSTVSVPYQIELSAEQNTALLTLTLDIGQTSQNRDTLYGMDAVIEGTYQRMSFTDEQLEILKENLGVPPDLNVTVTQGAPSYWDGGGRWLVAVSFYNGSEFIAGASFDPLTMEMCRNIYMYSGT